MNKFKGMAWVFLIIVPMVLISVLFLRQHAFDETLLDVQNSYEHIENLTSIEYNGRLTGSKGNEAMISYIESYFQTIGIEPAGDDDTYEQRFSLIVPQIDTQPVFNIMNNDGSIRKSLVMYQDYNAISSHNGGDVDYSGDMIFVGVNLLRIDPSLIQDRIVVMESLGLNLARVDYVMEHGGKGILFCRDVGEYASARRTEQTKDVSGSGKTGEDIFVGFLSREVYQDMFEMLEPATEDMGRMVDGTLSNVDIDIEMTFPIVETSNIIGKIEGQKNDGSVLMISADMDGLGQSVNGGYFPGAINNTSGIGLLLEIARVVAVQKDLPYETILFALWNGQEQDLAGSNYYTDNPLYDFQQTKVLHIENAGEVTLEGLKISSDVMTGNLLGDIVYDYAMDAGLLIEETWPTYGAINSFADKKVPAVLVMDSMDLKNNLEDTILQVELEALENTGLTILEYVKREVYKDRGLDYLNITERIILIVLILGAIINLVIGKLYKQFPNRMIGALRIEQIYYSTGLVFLRKFYKNVLPYVFVVYFLSILAHIDSTTNISKINDVYQTNFSAYLSFKESVLFIRSMFDLQMHQAQTIGNIFDVIYTSSYRSVLLIASALLLSTFFGMIRGMIEGLRSKRNSFRSMGTLVLFSLPDVLVVLAGLWLNVYIARNFPTIKATLPLSDFILPLLTLSLIPMIYISRITFIAMQEELSQDYIKNAKAKGYSRMRILINELLPAISFKIIDSMPTIMAMLLSNVLIVEYLFNYNGILYYLFYLYEREDVYRFVPLAITLGLIYMVFTYSIMLLGRLVNPLKRGGNK